MLCNLNYRVHRRGSSHILYYLTFWMLPSIIDEMIIFYFKIKFNRLLFSVTTSCSWIELSWAETCLESGSAEGCDHHGDDDEVTWVLPDEVPQPVEEPSEDGVRPIVGVLATHFATQYFALCKKNHSRAPQYLICNIHSLWHSKFRFFATYTNTSTSKHMSNMVDDKKALHLRWCHLTLWKKNLPWPSLELK